MKILKKMSFESKININGLKLIEIHQNSQESF